MQQRNANEFVPFGRRLPVKTWHAQRYVDALHWHAVIGHQQPVRLEASRAFSKNSQVPQPLPSTRSQRRLRSVVATTPIHAVGRRAAAMGILWGIASQLRGVATAPRLIVLPGCIFSTQERTRSASPRRLNLPAESRNTMISLRPATSACITRQRPASEM